MASPLPTELRRSTALAGGMGANAMTTAWSNNIAVPPIHMPPLCAQPFLPWVTMLSPDLGIVELWSLPLAVFPEDTYGSPK
jgi:hypothetical protein